MKTILLCFSCLLCLSVLRAQVAKSPDSFKLDRNDLFIISEYKEIQYENFSDDEGQRLPANLSSFHYYVDINGVTTFTNVVDVNYLYLRNYSKKDTMGEVVYLVTRKNRPTAERKTNIQSARTVDRYSDIHSVINVNFGYWIKDSNKIFVVFRESTKLKDMRDFRIFSGFIVNHNIYFTRGMNSKDEYLFDYKFKRNKDIRVKLPIPLENIFYAQKIVNKTESDSMKLLYQSEQSQKKNSTENSFQKKEIKSTDTVMASVKYWKYENEDFKKRFFFLLNPDDMELNMIANNEKKQQRKERKKQYGKKKHIHLKHSKNKIFVSTIFKVKRYKNYFEPWYSKEFIFLHVIDPYEEGVVHTFSIPYQR